MQQQAVFAANNTRLPPNATKASEGHASKAKAAYDPVSMMNYREKSLLVRVNCNTVRRMLFLCMK